MVSRGVWRLSGSCLLSEMRSCVPMPPRLFNTLLVRRGGLRMIYMSLQTSIINYIPGMLHIHDAPGYILFSRANLYKKRCLRPLPHLHEGSVVSVHICHDDSILQSWVSTFQSVVLTADVLHFFIKGNGHKRVNRSAWIQKRVQPGIK